MARPRKPIPARRYHLTLDRPIADRLSVYAKATHRPVSTAAAALIADALTNRQTGDEVGGRGALRQLQEVWADVQALRRQPGERPRRDDADQLPPRWEWPVEMLLADHEWWDRWLPRLREMMGRRLAPLSFERPNKSAGEPAPPSEALADQRGYHDVMAFLFPPVVSGAITITWRSPDYGDAARQEDAAGHGIVTAPARADVWEPVVRHVAEALCLLESTGQHGADPYLRLRAEAEIVGPWARILRYLVGDDEPELPRRRLP